ncbi:MAG: fibronectin type III-like domain-contianing protein, partial [Lachnospiraceae bacterium]|nr:fibronectin type III-like domain-contianing protein [Lachnospiraceae bacterium]
VAERVRPVRKLAAFDKITLQPGETKAVSFLIKKEQLGSWNSKMQFVVDSGDIEVYAGGCSTTELKAVCRI